jgi:hypothetical protein
MARTVTEWPAGKRRHRSPHAYDWPTWLDGQIWELTTAEWGGDANAFRSAAEHTARSYGGRVRVLRRDGGTMLVQFIEGSADGNRDERGNERCERLSAAGG